MICLVESIEDQKKLETRLIAFTKPINEEPIHSSNDNHRKIVKEIFKHGKGHSTEDFLNVEDSM